MVYIMINNLPFWKRLADNLGRVIGPHCEVVIHDFTEDIEHSVVYIVNGKLSNRTTGAPPTNLFFDHINDPISEDMLGDYITKQSDGRTFRSSTTLIRNETGKVIGSLCINIDITPFISMGSIVDEIIGKRDKPVEMQENYTNNVQDLFAHYLSSVEQMIGKPGSEMNKIEKIQALEYLDKCGVFQISRAHIVLCDFFQISKFTLYNYLDEVRQVKNQD